MELKPGYKQTEVGMIPKDWELSTLFDISKKITDGEHLTPRRTSNGYYLLSARNILDGHIDLSDVDYVGADEYRRIRERCNPEPGDVLISCSGTVGRVAVVPDGFECVMVRSAALVKPKSTRMSGHYLQYFLQSAAGQNQILVSLNQGAQANLFLNHIERLHISLPPTRAEQEAIAEALSDVDALISALDQLIAKKRDIKQAAMQQLLTGKQRLPGFNEIGRKNSEIGEIPSEWRIFEIGHIANVKTGPFGSSLHERDYVEDGTPIITVEHLGERGIVHTNLPMVSEIDRKRLTSYSLDQGDIVFSRVGSVDRNARVSSAEHGWLFSGRLLRVRRYFDNVDTTYLSYQFHSEPFKQRVRTVAVGQIMASLNTQILKGVLVALPPVPEQIAIAAVLSDMDAELAALEARREKTHVLKQGMMQELLTGKTRLV